MINRIPNENLHRYFQKYLLSDWRDFIMNNKAILGLLWGWGAGCLGWELGVGGELSWRFGVGG